MSTEDQLKKLYLHLVARIEWLADKESRAIESRHWTRVMDIILSVNQNFI